MPTFTTFSIRPPNSTNLPWVGGHNVQRKPSRRTCSACGACRMLRIKCDLKDVPPRLGETPTCSNCRDRSLNCINELADARGIKPRRRPGRILAQVMEIYGPATPICADALTTDTPTTDAPTDAKSTPASSSYTPSCIPKLQPEFFGSPFYRRFHIQRPIVDPTEFSARFFESERGTPESLGVAGSVICMLLVAWAATYGVNEYGVEEPSNGQEGVRECRGRCNEMIREILGLIDEHGLLRKPTLDGVRVLLLIMPLTEDVQTQLERLVMYEAAVSQVYALRAVGLLSESDQGEFVDALVRARIFWYGRVHDGKTTRLRGGRLIFEDDDLSSSQITFASQGENQSLVRTSINSSDSYKYATAPIRLSDTCRQIHISLTGLKAKRLEDVNEPNLTKIWGALTGNWEGFEVLRGVGPIGVIQPEDTERFVDGWQIFIFECHNIIRESLKQRVIEHQRTRDASFIVDPEASREPLLAKLTRLHAIAEGKCQDVAGQIVTLIRRHLGSSFFQYDASLVRDGCFYAGLCLVHEPGAAEEDIRTCIQALEEMRWVFSESEERIAILSRAWENCKAIVVQPDSTRGGKSSYLPMTPVDNLFKANSDLARTTMWNGDTNVDTGPSTSVSEATWQGHTPSSASSIHSYHDSPSTGAATIFSEKMPPVGLMTGPISDLYYNNSSSFMGSFDTTGRGHFANNTFYGQGSSAYGVDTGGLLMDGHRMEASSAQGSATWCMLNTEQYHAYYPHFIG